MSSESRLPHRSPLPPVVPISPFEEHFAESMHHQPYPSRYNQSYNDPAIETSGPTFRIAQDTTMTPISLTERRQAQTERKVKAWIRSTTPEFDMVTGIDAIVPSAMEQEPRPTFKRAASTPYLKGNLYEPSMPFTIKSNLRSAREAGQLSKHDQPQRSISPKRNESPSIDYRDLDPYAKVAFVPVRNGSISHSQYRRPFEAPDSRDQHRFPPADSEPSNKHPRRPNPFSRGFSAGDIHTARLQEIHNPSLLSIASHHTAASSSTKGSRPSLSNAFSVPRSEGFPGDIVPGGVTMERKAPRKQPSLMKGLRGSLFGLLHKGEGEESKARRKESKMDLRAQATQPYSNENDLERKPTLDTLYSQHTGGVIYQESRRGDGKASTLHPPPANSRPHFRRSSNSAPDDLPRTRLFSPITLRKAQAPSVWESHKELNVSESIESLTSPPRSSSLPRSRNEDDHQHLPMDCNKPLVRQFRSGSDTAAWEKRLVIPPIPHRSISNIAAHGLPCVGSFTDPTLQKATHTKLLPTTPEGVLKTHRPRSRSWGAAEMRSGHPIMPLRLQKKRSEPILSNQTSRMAPLSYPTASKTLVPQDLDNMRFNSTRSSGPLIGSEPPQISMPGTRASPRTVVSEPVHISDIFASPTGTEIYRQETAMKALEQALGAPAWSDVDFRAISREPRTEPPRAVSPKTNDRVHCYISPDTSPHRKITVVKTPPRDPLPRAPSLSTPRRRVPPALNLTRTPDHPETGFIRESKLKPLDYPPLPRLSYSFDKQAAENRKSKTGPRLVSVIFPSSAPATKVEFDMEPTNGLQSAQETKRLPVHVTSDAQTDWQEKYVVAVRELSNEREKRMKSESDLMRLHGKYLGAVKRISQLEIEIDQMHRCASYGGLPEMTTHSTLSQSTSMGSTLSSDSFLHTPTKNRGINLRHRGQKEQVQGGGHEKMGSMDTIDQLEMDLGQPWTSRMGR